MRRHHSHNLDARERASGVRRLLPVVVENDCSMLATRVRVRPPIRRIDSDILLDQIKELRAMIRKYGIDQRFIE
jgi:hypothetical protein